MKYVENKHETRPLKRKNSKMSIPVFRLNMVINAIAKVVHPILKILSSTQFLVYKDICKHVMTKAIVSTNYEFGQVYLSN